MPKNLLLKNEIDAAALARIQVIISNGNDNDLSLLLKKLSFSFYLLPQDDRLQLIQLWADKNAADFTAQLPQLLSTLPPEDRLLHIPPHILQRLAKTAPDHLLKIMHSIIELIPAHMRQGLIMPEW